MHKRAVFLDKDGTVIVNVPYNADPDRIELMPGAGFALRQMIDAGYELVMITNQAGIGHGYFPESALGAVWKRVNELLAKAGVVVSAFYYCPHHPQAELPEYRVACECRKPRSGMLQRAAAERHIDLASSWFIGDILDDVEAGNTAGCRTILVDVGSETEWQISARRLPDYQVNSLQAAAELIEAVRTNHAVTKSVFG